MAMYLGEDKVASLGSICNVSGSASKNIFYEKNPRAGYYEDGGVWKDANDITSYGPFYVKGTIYVSATFVGASYYRIIEFKEDGTYIKRTARQSNGALTLDSNTSYIIVSNNTTSSIYLEDFMITRGNTATEYEEYYEPTILIKDSNGNYHEVPYVTGKASKNLFNMLDSSHFVFRGKSNIYQSFKLSSYSSNEIKVTGGNGNYTEGYIDVSGLKPNTPYKVSYKIKENTLGFNPGMWINGDSSDTGTLTITVGLNNGSTSVSSSNYVIFTDIQLEEGAVITSYEEPFEPTLSIRTSNGTFREVDINEDNYSLGEQRIGTWIDGKPLYRKTFNTTSPNQTSSSAIITQLDSGCAIVRYDGYLETSAKARYPLNCWFSSTDYVYSFISNLNEIKLRVSLSAYASRPIEITLWYTKN